MANQLGTDYVHPQADVVLWALQQDPCVMCALLEHNLLPSLQGNKLFCETTSSRTYRSYDMEAIDTDESLIFSIDPKLLLGLCARNLIKPQFHFKNDQEIANWLGLTCPPRSLPPGFPGKLAYEEHCSLDWMKKIVYFER